MPAHQATEHTTERQVEARTPNFQTAIHFVMFERVSLKWGHTQQKLGPENFFGVF